MTSAAWETFDRRFMKRVYKWKKKTTCKHYCLHYCFFSVMVFPGWGALIEKAGSIGANAVINVKYTTGIGFTTWGYIDAKGMGVKLAE